MSEQELRNLLQLEGKTNEGDQWIVPIMNVPFVIGRKAGCNLYLSVEGISRIHAKIYHKDDGWWISDCQSTNGTFLNRQRLTQEMKIKPGDSLQFAGVHFTVAEYSDISERTQLTNPHAIQFEQMMVEKAVTPYFQPILRYSDLNTVGFEILGRVHYKGLPVLPGMLFRVARNLDLDVELSKLFREIGFAQADQLLVKEILFFNLLPAEMDIDSIFHGLGKVREMHPNLKLAMELHESVLTNVSMIRRLRETLKALGILLVYDDFGSGQARLLELIEAPPDVIKFDISLIHDINYRSKSSQAIIGSLVKMAREAGIHTLAEGVETKEESEICKEIGFDLVQGYYFGRPTPIVERNLNSKDVNNNTVPSR